MSVALPNDATDPELLIQAWSEAADAFTALAHDLSDDEWSAKSILPAWSNGDIVAHVAHLDGLLLGELQVDHAPDWQQLPHAQTPFQKLTEYGVDVRRTRPRQEVLDELDRVTAGRRSQLVTADRSEVIAFIGLELTFPRLMRRRTLDTWTHLLDIEFGTQRELSPQDGLAPKVAAGMWVEGLPRIVGKDAGAPAGSVVRITCTGPGVEFDTAVFVDTNGRGMFVSTQEPATTTIDISWLHFLALAAGRLPRTQLSIDVSGDLDLGEAVLAHLTMTP